MGIKIIIEDQPSKPCWDMFGDISPKLGLVVFDLACFLGRHGTKEMHITSIIRPMKNDSGVHACGRGIDVSVKNIDKEILPVAREYINQKYQYDSARPRKETMVIHVGSGYEGDKAVHIHLQVLE